MTDPTILFQDEDILVLEKPSGMTVNKADTTKEDVTVQDWIANNFQFQKKIIQQSQSTTKDTYDPVVEFYSRGGIVHRLDKETSGILVVAKNWESFANLKKQFMDRTVKKMYTALAHGRLSPQTGEINAPVGRLPFNRTHFGVIAGGREATTLYAVKSYLEFKGNREKEVLSLIELFPQTGRTHQIRVHLKYLNHPIFADPLYAGRKVSKNDRTFLSRLFLHATKITLTHPVTAKPMEFSSKLPTELLQFLSGLIEITN